MNNNIFILIGTWATLSFACTEKHNNKNEQSSHTNDAIPYNADSITTIKVVDTLKENNITIPSKYFIEMVSIIDSLGFVGDTNRIKKVPYYYSSVHNNVVFSKQGLTFYLMDTIENRVFNYLRTHENISEYVKNSSNYKHSMNYWEDSIKTLYFSEGTFHKVKSITGFYFADKNTSDFRSDGFIEEWEFVDSADSKKAELLLSNPEADYSKIYYFVYFNSFAHVFRKGKYLYTFYSRATWDAKRLDKSYKLIIKNINLDSHTKPFYK